MSPAWYNRPAKWPPDIPPPTNWWHPPEKKRDIGPAALAVLLLAVVGIVAVAVRCG